MIDHDLGVAVIVTVMLVMEMARRQGVPLSEIFAIILVAMFFWWMGNARADALWDFYFGPGSVRCDKIGANPELAVAVAHGLPIAAAKPATKILAWFATHPEYDAEIAEQRAFMERTCRDTD